MRGTCADCGGRCDHRATRCRACASQHKRGRLVGDKSDSWRGGRTVTSHGYVAIKAHDHPAAHATGYVYEHRLVAEQMLGRKLEYGEVVHHRNGVKSDNRAENLEILNRGSHAKHHARERGSLSDAQVVELILAGLPSDTIARDYRVTNRRIVRIRQEVLGLEPFQQIRPRGCPRCQTIMLLRDGRYLCPKHGWTPTSNQDRKQ